MGYGRELAIELELEAFMRDIRPDLLNTAKSGYWITRDGRRLKITDMSDSHLRNTINMLKRGSMPNNDVIAELQSHLASRQ